MRVNLSIALVLALTACASQQTLTPQGGFVQTLGKTHPFTGRVYSGTSRDFVDADDLKAAAAHAQFLVLGETHDNRDHHALEAELVDTFLQAHPSAAVGFEMLDEHVRAALANAPRDPDALARAVDWENSGWPEFSQYRPVFKVALERGATLIAAHPSAEHVRASLAGVPADETHALHLDQPLSAAAQTQLEREIRESHCGHAPAAMVEAMVRAQSYKDAFMARSIFEAHKPVALVTGRGHARTDRAVPHYLRLFGATNVLSVAFVEVEDIQRVPEAYDLAAYDYVVFTPRVSDEDPCARFKEQLKQMQEHGSESGAE